MHPDSDERRRDHYDFYDDLLEAMGDREAAHGFRVILRDDIYWILGDIAPFLQSRRVFHDVMISQVNQLKG